MHSTDDTAPFFGQPVDFEFMSPSDWLEFHCELYDVVADLGLVVGRIDPGVVRLADGRSLGLLQLAQHCHLRERGEWRGLIEAHLTTVTEHLGHTTTSISLFDLRIRLVPDTPADAATFEKFGARPFAEGVVQLLAVDVADAVRCVSADEITRAGWDLDEAWASARLQTELLEQVDEVHEIDLGGASVVHVFDERPFAASMVRIADELIAEVAGIGEHGAIVSIPSRHSVLVHPVDGANAQVAIDALIPITRQLYKQGPGSVSPHLYWWRNGELNWIPTFFEPHADGYLAEAFLPPELQVVVTG